MADVLVADVFVAPVGMSGSDRRWPRVVAVGS